MPELLDIGIKILELMFYIGIAGSTVVVGISFIEDLEILFED